MRAAAPTFPTRPVAVEDLAEPSAVSLNIAQSCNLSCSYCYADEGLFGGRPVLMTEETACAIIDRALDGASGAPVTIGFIGGEPFLNREVLHRSVAYARAGARRRGLAVRFSVTTNGTLLRPDDVVLLRENDFAVSVSLDGDATLHDRHRRMRSGKGSHTSALKALAPLLRNPGRVKVAAHATVPREDLRVLERVAALVDAGFHEVGVSPLRTGPDPTLTLRGDDWALFLDEMMRAGEWELDRLRRGGRPRFSNLATALKQIHRGACRPLPCGAAANYVSASADGHYFTCHRTVGDRSFWLGDREGGPSRAMRANFLAARHVDRQEPCASCWARYLCGGGCHAEVTAAGREGCDYIRGWLEFCLRAYNEVAAAMPDWFMTAGGAA